MEKLIIRNNSTLRTDEAVKLVASVVSDGKISGKKNSDQYCYVTIFNKKHTVSCKKNKAESFTFDVWDCNA